MDWQNFLIGVALSGLVLWVIFVLAKYKTDWDIICRELDWPGGAKWYDLVREIRRLKEAANKKD